MRLGHSRRGTRRRPDINEADQNVSDKTSLALHAQSAVARAARLADKGDLADSLNQVIVESAPTARSSELVWSLWVAAVLDVQLSQEAAQAVSGIDDSFVALSAMLCDERGLFPSLDRTNWNRRVRSSELWDDQWLLAYEMHVRGWSASSSSPLVGTEFEYL